MEIIDLVVQYAIKHSSTRWVRLKHVAVRLSEQWENINNYFLVLLSKQRILTGEIKDTKRYNTNEEGLRNVHAEWCLASPAYVSQDFETFLLKFQYYEKLIH